VTCNKPLYSGVPTSVWRVLLALFLLVESTNVALFVGAGTVEESIGYTECLADRSGCTALCACLPPSVLGAAYTRVRRC